MYRNDGSEALMERREIAVVLRLLVETEGELIYGEVVDVDTNASRRFIAWRDLEPTVRAALREALQRATRSDDSPRSPH